MMRVTRIATDGEPKTLLVEGRLTHQSAEELRMACEAVVTEHGSLHLDLSGLQFVDPTGAGLLRGLERRGARLTGCSGFIEESLARGHEADESTLLERLRAGDARAFEMLVRRYGGRMIAAARRIVGTEDEARDVVQEAFLAAFRALDRFNGDAQVSTWLHRIVINAALMRLRSRRRRREEAIEDHLPRFDDDGHWVDSPGSWDTPADALLERRETRRLVRAAIERLPAQYREVVVLRDIEELDTDEAASILGVTPNAVKTRLHRARQALRTLLERDLRVTTDDPRRADRSA